MALEKKQLTELSREVHQAVKRLKLGEHGTIKCGKAYKAEQVKAYLWAYALHKNKWFESKYDPTSQVMYVTRAAPPPWPDPDDDDDDEEP